MRELFAAAVRNGELAVDELVVLAEACAASPWQRSDQGTSSLSSGYSRTLTMDTQRALLWLTLHQSLAPPTVFQAGTGKAQLLSLSSAATRAAQV